MTLITLTDPKQSHVKIAIDENDYTNLARYRALGYFDADEETVETNQDDEIIIVDDKETDDTNEADELVDSDEETVETKDEAETVADEEEKPKPRRRRRTVEK